jgi:hypothetical protein
MNVTTLLLKRHDRLHASIAAALGLLLLTLPIVHAMAFGSPIRITTNSGLSENPSVVAYWDYVYAAWPDDTPVTGSGGYSEIWMRASSNHGASFGSAIRITTNTGVSENPSVAAYITYVCVAWDDDTPVSGSGSAPEIWLRAGN